MSNSGGTFEIVTGKNEQAEHVVSVVVKRSYKLNNGQVLQRLDNDGELRKIDEYWDDGDPEWSTVKYESELVACKFAVDVVVIGKAHAPDGKPVSHLLTSVKTGTHEKSIGVIGDRVCQHRPDSDPVFSDPEPFTEMELRYDRAYGGSDEVSDQNLPFFYPRNTMGTGVVLHNTKDAVDGLRLPNLEDIHNLLTPERIVIGDPETWPDLPMPQGYGWLQRTWYPRSALMGAYPAFVGVSTVTPEERMSLLPKDHIALAKQMRLPTFEARFNNGASIGMLHEAIETDALFSLTGFCPDGDITFTLPDETPQMILDIGRGEEQLDAQLDTVIVKTEEREVELLWRGAAVYEGYSWWAKAQQLCAQVQ